MRDVTDSDVKYCFEDEEWEHVLRNTVDSQMHRLPIMDHDKRLGGIVCTGDLATKSDATPAGEALGGISQPR